MLFVAILHTIPSGLMNIVLTTFYKHKFPSGISDKTNLR
jgi:hypothetical protein